MPGTVPQLGNRAPCVSAGNAGVSSLSRPEGLVSARSSRSVKTMGLVTTVCTPSWIGAWALEAGETSVCGPAQLLGLGSVIYSLCFFLSSVGRHSNYSHISFYCALLHCTLQTWCFFFYKWKVCGHPAWHKARGAVFPTVFAHVVSVSHFGNSHNISDSFVIITFYLW